MSNSLFVLIQGGVVTQPPISLPAGVTPASIFGSTLVFADVTALTTPPPVGDSATEAGGVWTFSPPFTSASSPTVPKQVSTYQFKAVLATTSGSGGTMLDNVNTYVATLSETIQVQWASAPALLRVGGLVSALEAHFSWADGTVDGWFEAAAAIPNVV